MKIPRGLPRGIFDRKEFCLILIRSLTPQQAAENALTIAVQVSVHRQQCIALVLISDNADVTVLDNGYLGENIAVCHFLPTGSNRALFQCKSVFMELGDPPLDFFFNNVIFRANIPRTRGNVFSRRTAKGHDEEGLDAGVNELKFANLSGQSSLDKFRCSERWWFEST